MFKGSAWVYLLSSCLSRISSGLVDLSSSFAFGIHPSGPFEVIPVAPRPQPKRQRRRETRPFRFRSAFLPPIIIMYCTGSRCPCHVTKQK